MSPRSKITVPKVVFYTKCCGAPHYDPCHGCPAEVEFNIECDKRRRSASQRLAPLSSGERDPWVGQ